MRRDYTAYNGGKSAQRENSQAGDGGARLHYHCTERSETGSPLWRNAVHSAPVSGSGAHGRASANKNGEEMAQSCGIAHQPGAITCQL